MSFNCSAIAQVFLILIIFLPSFLSFCRVKVSQDGQFLHYVFPYQFLDSPEWESLRPSEDGTFQVMFFVIFRFLYNFLHLSFSVEEQRV